MAYGYNVSYGSNSQLAVAAPTKVKCNRCNIVKPSAAFSTRGLAELATFMKRNKAFDPVKGTYVPCTGCTTRQVNELKCNVCSETKGLHKFSKAQRKDPDEAVCWTCAEERANYEPGANDEDDDDSDRDCSSDSSSDVEGMGAVIDSTASLSVSTYPSSGGGVSLSSVQNSTTSTSASTVISASKSSSSSIPVGFRTGKYGTPGRKTPAGSGSSRAFAKVPAVPRKTYYQGAEEDRRGSDESD